MDEKIIIMDMVMNSNMQLAQSVWPRSGADNANRSHVSIPGPETGRILMEVKLPQIVESNTHRKICGCVITDTMTLRVVSEGILSSMTISGEILWSVDLNTMNDEPGDWWYSLPVALQGGACLVTLPESAIIYDDHGKYLSRIKLENQMVDDSGFSPNLTNNGHLIVTCCNGEVLSLSASGIKLLDAFGYDILPPAVYTDNSLAIAGYCGTGFCRTRVDGQMVWGTKFHEADLLPTINEVNICAVGSMNDNTSAFFTPQGEQVGAYDRDAIFAEYSSFEWIAQSYQYVAKIMTDGQECWGYELQNDSNWNHCQPIVDSQGRIYLLDNTSLFCLDGKGNILFTTDLVKEASRGCISCIGPGKIAYVGQGILKIIG